MKIVESRRLDNKGRCCGRKPMVYKRPHPSLFCDRCHAAYDPATGEQIANWAYRWHDNSHFEAKTSKAG